MIIPDSYDHQNGSQEPSIKMVILKELNWMDSDRHYYIRPYQHLGTEKFCSYKVKRLYCYVKVLKKIFGIGNFNMYMLKKILMKPELRTLDVLRFER